MRDSRGDPPLFVRLWRTQEGLRSGVGDRATFRIRAWRGGLEFAILTLMSQHVFIDGNNLLYAMHAHAPVPSVGRETLVRIVERWARQGDDDVTIIFDGPVPHGGLSAQMSSSRITVRFSAPKTADDVIVALVHRARLPDMVRVITGDTAIRREARLRRCGHTEAVAFVRELFPPEGKHRPAAGITPEKPTELSPEEAQEWVDLFDVDDADEPFEGHDAMEH